MATAALQASLAKASPIVEVNRISQPSTTGYFPLLDTSAIINGDMNAQISKNKDKELAYTTS